MNNKTKHTDQNVEIDIQKISGETPMVVSEILEKTLYTGFFGTLDSMRIKQVTDKLMQTAERKEAESLIIDLGNVDTIDTAVAGHLIKVSKTLRLVGVKTYFCAIKTVVAQSMVNAGISLQELITFRVLKDVVYHIIETQQSARQE